MNTLAELGPTKLQPAEQEQIRETADCLFFCDDLPGCPDAIRALEDVRGLARRLVESDRWLDETADGLLLDLEACGPLSSVR